MLTSFLIKIISEKILLKLKKLNKTAKNSLIILKVLKMLGNAK